MRFFYLFSCFVKPDQNDINKRLYHFVSIKNHKKVLKLLKKGADPNINILYNEPIDVAIHNNDLKMIKLLMFYGAKIKDEFRLFCKDCRRNFDYIDFIYNLHKKLLNCQIQRIYTQYKVPSGLDNYLKQFLF